MELKDLQHKLVNVIDEAERIRQQYAGKSESMSAEERTRYDALCDEGDALKGQIEDYRRTASLKAFSAELEPMLPLAGRGAAADGDEPGVARMDPATRKAMKSFFSGREFSNFLPEQQTALKALMSSEGDLGGFLVVPQELSQRFIEIVQDNVYMRQMATVIPMAKAESLGVAAFDTDLGDPTWTSELDAGAEDTTKPFSKRALTPHPLARYISLSNKLLRQAAFDAEGLVLARLAYKVARVEENAFLNGSGAQQPLGVFVASANGVDTSRDTTTGTTGTIGADDFISAKYNLKPQYWPRARWIMHRSVVSVVRQLKDSQGQYLWQNGVGGFVAQGTALASGTPPMIQDIPVIISELAPAITQANGSITGNPYVAVLGDFSFYYIADALDIQIQRLTELRALQNQTLFTVRKETDGLPTLAEAFQRLKVK